MGLFKKLINQTRKPEGLLGKMILRSMNHGHAKLADWGMRFLPERQPERILEIGCGGGRNAAELMKRYPQSRVTGIDYSPLAVEKARTFNRSAIAARRCEILEGDVSKLPFEGESFDLATAFETVYFWPGLEQCFAQVHRALRQGGRFVIVNESDGLDTTARYFEKIIDGMKLYTAGQISESLRAAGFSRVKVRHCASKPWITVIAEK